jgi:hypothetical protein
MLETSDFLRPEFQNQPRFRKPPLAYWTAASGMALSGTRREAWAARLPFVAAALGCIFLLIRMGGESGTWSALLFLFSFGFWRFASLAETDFLQLFGILLAFYAHERRQGPLCGLGMTLAVLAKGPAAVAIPLLTWTLSRWIPPTASRRDLRTFWLPALALQAAVRLDPTLPERHDELMLRRFLRDYERHVEQLACAVGSGEDRFVAGYAEMLVPIYRRRGVRMNDVVTLVLGLEEAAVAKQLEVVRLFFNDESVESSA